MTELEVTPSDRAGVLARFGVRRETSSRPRGVPHGRRSGRSGRHSWAHRWTGDRIRHRLRRAGVPQEPGFDQHSNHRCSWWLVPSHIRLRQRQLAGGHRSGDLQMSHSRLPLAIAAALLTVLGGTAHAQEDLRVYDRQPGLRQHQHHHQRAVHDHRQLRRDLLLHYWRSRCAPAPMSVPARAAATHRGTRDI